jgi:hypothetical protein
VRRTGRLRLHALLLEEDPSGEVGRAAAQMRHPPAGKGVSLPQLGSASPQGIGLNPERGSVGKESTRMIG